MATLGRWKPLGEAPVKALPSQAIRPEGPVVRGYEIIGNWACGAWVLSIEPQCSRNRPWLSYDLGRRSCGRESARSFGPSPGARTVAGPPQCASHEVGEHDGKPFLASRTGGRHLLKAVGIALPERERAQLAENARAGRP